MKRRTHLFLLAVDEDPIPGAFDKDRIVNDVKDVIARSIIGGYFPRVVELTAVERPSNFMQDVTLGLSAVMAEVVEDEDGDVDLDATRIIFSQPISIEYKAYTNERPGDE